MGLFSLFLASCPLIEGRQREWNGREALASLEWNFSAAEGPPAHNPQTPKLRQPNSLRSLFSSLFSFLLLLRTARHAKEMEEKKEKPTQFTCSGPKDIPFHEKTKSCLSIHSIPNYLFNFISLFLFSICFIHLISPNSFTNGKEKEKRHSVGWARLFFGLVACGLQPPITHPRTAHPQPTPFPFISARSETAQLKRNK